MSPTLLTAVALLFAGAISPGPNAFIVLQRASHGGGRAALAAIAGVIAGSLLLVLLAAAGAGPLLAAAPALGPAITALGCLHLGFLGARLIAARPREDDERVERTARLPAGVGGLLAFQLVNPKAWLMALTVTASARQELGILRAVPFLAVLFVVTPAVCLALWAWAGVALGHRLERPGFRTRVDRAMGALLALSALLLLIDTWR